MDRLTHRYRWSPARRPALRRTIALAALLVACGAGAVGVLGRKAARDLCLGTGRILGPARDAQVEFDGVRDDAARVFTVATPNGTLGQLVVFAPDRARRLLTIELDGRTFGFGVSDTPGDNVLLAGRFLAQSEMGRKWKPELFVAEHPEQIDVSVQQNAVFVHSAELDLIIRFVAN